MPDNNHNDPISPGKQLVFMLVVIVLVVAIGHLVLMLSDAHGQGSLPPDNTPLPPPVPPDDVVPVPVWRTWFPVVQ
jgi:hypothetical protein